jgi:hypothetical protein
MKEIRQISRWAVENDPSWEQQFDTVQNLLKWRKRGSNIIAIGTPSSMSCDLYDNPPEGSFSDLPHIGTHYVLNTKASPDDPANITRYLSSRYLNPNYDSHNFRGRRLRVLGLETPDLDVP